MKRRFSILRRTLFLPLAALLLLVLVLGGTATAQAQQVAIDTAKGTIVVELDPQAAPKSVENFLQYVRDGFYDGTVFHRVIDGFMIQGGGFTADLSKKPVKAPVRNESDNGLSNTRGTLAMARTADPHSATAQFYINLVDNSGNLDARGSTLGYTVFGRVIDGMGVVDAIAKVPTDFQRAGGGMMRDVPVDPVVIEKVTVR